MTAANRFLAEILSNNWPKPVNTSITRLRVSLHGSLAFTGLGHATDRAVILGLLGQQPASVDPDDMDKLVQSVYQTKKFNLPVIRPTILTPKKI
ncbi:L-serine dehydratase [Bartonella apihabitans]|nr:L-serine dehydratase [Bartonella apihabitans]